MTPRGKRLLQVGAVAVFVAAVALVPLALDSFQRYQFALVAMYFVAITGLNVLTGYTGQISLGHGAFMAIGGYTTAILTVDHGVSEIATIPLAGLVAGVGGAPLRHPGPAPLRHVSRPRHLRRRRCHPGGAEGVSPASPAASPARRCRCAATTGSTTRTGSLP